MNWRAVEEGTTEPVTLAEVKSHLRITHSEEDTLLNSLITAARVHAEDFTRRSLITRTAEVLLDEFPTDEIWLPYMPVTSVTSIKYTDYEDTETTLDSSNYIVDIYSRPPRIVCAYGESWPSDTLKPVNGVAIQYECGGDVPEPIKQGILMHVAHLYEHREAVYTGYTVITTMPLGLEALYWPYRIWGW